MKKRAHLQKLFRFAREERASELVEFAMTAWLLFLLLFGVYQWGYALYAYHFATYAAEEGSRYAGVHGHTWSEYETENCSSSAPPSFTMKYGCTASAADIQNYVQSLSTGAIQQSNVTINETGTYLWPGTTPDCSSGCSACTATNSQGCFVKVTVSYTFNFLPFLKFTALTMSATSENVILQ